MENTFLDSIKREMNYTETENCGISHKSTLDAVYDMFALGGAYRSRSDEDCILLFKKALEENEELALKCLFYLRDIRCGQGERRFFRVCFKWLAKNYPELAFRNLDNIPEYGRWDDLYCVEGTELRADAFDVIQCQLNKDLMSLKEGEKEGVSLLGKWLKSENASAEDTKYLANQTRIALGYSHKKYRKILSALRTRINIVEKLMSEGRWEEIEFAKLPSKAGLIYRNAFAHNDLIKDKYEAFINSKETKVNAATLYPYEIVKKVTDTLDYCGRTDLEETEREVLNKYWNSQKDYLEGKPCKMMCVVDTSGSMDSSYGTSVKPIDVAISLGMYCGERIGEPFKNCFISFSSRPQLIEIDKMGIDFCSRVKNIYQTNLCSNTDIEAVFKLLKNTILETGQKDILDTIVIISDMQIDKMSYWRDEERVKSEMERIRIEWEQDGLKMPHLIYWCVDAKKDTILDLGPNVTCCSGCSPIIFKQVLTGKTGIELCLEILNSKRYESIR